MAAFTDIEVQRADHAEDFAGDGTPVPIQLISQWALQREDGRTTGTPRHVRFALDDLGGVSGVEAWLAATAPHRSAIARSMRVLYSNGANAGESFLSAAAAIDAYDMKRCEYDGLTREQSYYVNRVKRTAAKAGSVFSDLVGGKIDVWADQVRDIRNNLAHHNPAADGALLQHHVFGRSVHWCLVFALMAEASFPKSTYDRIQDHNDYLALRRELARMLELPKEK